MNFRIDRRAMRNKSVSVSAETIAQMDRFDGRWRTLSSTAKECGCHLLQVRLVASTYDLMRTEKKTGRLVLVADADVTALSFIMHNRAYLRDASNALGTDDRVLEDIVRHGLLTPVLRAGRDGTKVNTFLKQDIEEFATRLLGRCDRSDEPCGTERSLLSARLLVRLDVLRQAIDTGKIRVRYAATGPFALRHVMIREQDVEDLRRRNANGARAVGDLTAKPGFDHWRARVAEIVAVQSFSTRNASSAQWGRRSCAAPTAIVVPPAVDRVVA